MGGKRGGCMQLVASTSRAVGYGITDDFSPFKLYTCRKLLLELLKIFLLCLVLGSGRAVACGHWSNSV